MSRYGRECRDRMFVKDYDQQVMNAVLGLNGEAGEIADHFKKILFHPPHPKHADLDLRSEIGDVLWYLATLNDLMYGDSLLDVAKENIRKLQTRWPERYTDVNIEDLTL